MSEAYQILSDKEKREKYDQYGSSYFEQGGGDQGAGGHEGFHFDFGNAFEFFSKQFGGGGSNIKFDFGGGESGGGFNFGGFNFGGGHHQQQHQQQRGKRNPYMDHDEIENLESEEEFETIVTDTSKAFLVKFFSLRLTKHLDKYAKMFEKTAKSLLNYASSLAVDCDVYPSLCSKCTKKSQHSSPIFILFNAEDKSDELEDCIKKSITFTDPLSAKNLVDFVHKKLKSFVHSVTSVASFNNLVKEQQKIFKDKAVVVLMSNKETPSQMFVSFSRRYRDNFIFVYISSLKIANDELKSFKEKFSLDSKEPTLLFVLPDQPLEQISSSTYYKHEKTFSKIDQFLKSYQLGLEQLRKKRQQKMEKEDTNVHLLSLNNFDDLCPQNSKNLCVFLLDNSSSRIDKNLAVMKKLAVSFQKDNLRFMYTKPDDHFHTLFKSVLEGNSNYKSSSASLIVFNRRRYRYSFYQSLSGLLDEDSCEYFLDALLGGSATWKPVEAESLKNKFSDQGWFQSFKKIFSS